MAWSDAARRAAAEARRRRRSAVTGTFWYHGSQQPIKGQHLVGGHFYTGGTRGGRNPAAFPLFAANKIKSAKDYGKVIYRVRLPQGRSVAGGTLFEEGERPPWSVRASKTIEAQASWAKPVTLHVSANRRMIATRLPTMRVRGRISRGK